MSEIDPVSIANSLLSLINTARTNPSQLKPYLNERIESFEGQVYTTGNVKYQSFEGKPAVEELLSHINVGELKNSHHLERNSYLDKAASMLGEHLSETGEISHSGKNSNTLEDRLSSLGLWKGNIAELISFQYLSASDFLLHWLINDGVESRGDRKHLLSPLYKKIGIHVGKNKDHGTQAVVVLAREFFERLEDGTFRDGVTEEPLFDESLGETIPEEIKELY